MDTKLKRLVRFKYTKTNLLLWQTVVVVVADFADYDKALLFFPNFEVRLRCCLPLCNSVVVAVLLMKSSVVVAVVPMNE